MPNYIEFDDKIAFHPGYYIEEIVEDSGLTQEDFARRLDTTPKNLSVLIRGEQSLSKDIAMKLSRMLGTSISYWLNLQKVYDTMIAEFESMEELQKEKEILKKIDYKYFRDNFGLPALPKKIDEQVEELRGFLNVSTLRVFEKENLCVSFRSENELSVDNIIKANMMMQIAINKALNVDAPRFNMQKFLEAIKYALTLTKDHENFHKLIKNAFWEAGVIFVILPSMSGSKINGATKKVGKNIVLMVNDRRLYSDTFWFTLFHEIGHIIHKDYGITFDNGDRDKESEADVYAEDTLIPRDKYNEFVKEKKYGVNDIKKFADDIDRDPGIVLGRLQHDKLVGYTNPQFKDIKHRYKVVFV